VDEFTNTKRDDNDPATGDGQGDVMTMATERAQLAHELAPKGGAAFSDAWRTAIEAWLIELFAEARQGAGLGDRPDAPGLALAAVGGTGRGDLAPESDLDLLLLHDKGIDPAAVAELLWYPIWDQGLKLGHAVRTDKDALAFAASDLETATALLACRHLAGDAELTNAVAEGAKAQWRKKSKWALGGLRRATRERWEANGELAFLLEPDLKEARGGLRDIHALRWADQAASVLDPADAEDLAACEQVLFDARVALHSVTGRATERLGLEDQDAVAAVLGTDADGLMGSLSAAGRRVAWVADEVWDRVAGRLSADRPLLGWRSRSRSPGVVVKGGQVLLEPNVDPANRPELLFDVAEVAMRTGSRSARATLSRLAERTPDFIEPWKPAFRDRFVALLAAGHDAVPVIESFDNVGIWTRFLPEWDAVRSRPQRNAYHRFTVDRHLLEAVANSSALVDQVDRPDLLLVGTMLHDIAKGRPGDHSVVGAELADAIATRMGFEAEDRAVIVKLVRHHLLLPDIATRRDLSDPVTIATVADAVGDRTTLHLLAALTEADSLATGPAAWSPWKAELVRDLVRRVDIHLAGGDPGRIVVDAFPSKEHAELVRIGEVAVQLVETRLTVVAPDRPGLLSRVTGALALQGMVVQAADAAVLDGFAIEQFQIESSFGPTIDGPRVEAMVRAALLDRLAIEARLAEREKTYGSGRSTRGLPPPVVRFDDAASETATVVEVHAPDRSGLLYRLARVFAELSLDVSQVKAQTLGGLAIDAFYITHGDGSLVEDEEIRTELERGLRHAVR
jgi:[protein-PII] uridylyltransferase